ncbi:MAG TPA: hypothetical protein PLH22_01935 [Candidatus Colwellbacteria bacterium]|jgi:hypothetical protein|nr:hypothetical protein [Candidatus Colwellbacteria bacterium]
MDKRKITLFVSGIVVLIAAVFLSVWDSNRNEAGACVILPQAYCDIVEENYADSQFIGMTANIPAFTKVYAPFDGTLKYSGTTIMNGTRVGVWSVENNPSGSLNEQSTAAVFLANLTRILGEGNSVNVRKGDFIGRTTKALAAESGYNFLVDFKRYNAGIGYSLTDADLTRQFFPAQ